jgi:hypothetical protein
MGNFIFTTKHTKGTKFGKLSLKFFSFLRDLRALRGENPEWLSSRFAALNLFTHIGF